MPPLNDISRLVKTAAAEAGFELAGIAGVGEYAELEEFPAWIEAGYGGEMDYLSARDEQQRLKRASLKHAAPWAKSVVVCAINYNTAQPYSTQAADPNRGWISRYAWSKEDYHDAVMRRLRHVEERMCSAVVSRSADVPSSAGVPPAVVGASSPAHGGTIQTRCYVDTGPLVERVYAKYAGIGLIGKNTCIINQQRGSWLFLGVILTSLELTPDLPAPDRCGSCTRCLDACPTNAFVSPYQLDASRCISYLTIEKRGDIPEDFRGAMGRHVFGCDICQDVCPWNRRAEATTAPEFQPRPELVNPALEWLAALDQESFRHKFRGSPVKRTKFSGLRRNAAVAMGNSGNREFIPRLRDWASGPDEHVASHARWALDRLEKNDSH